MLIVGIDPGLTGAFAILNEDGLVTVEDLPTIERGTGRVKNQIDPTGLAAQLENHLSGCTTASLLVLIEQQQAMAPQVRGVRQGVSSVFSLGLTAGIIEATVAVKGWPYQLVNPNKWKSAMKVRKGKEAARAAALRLYPQADLHRKKDHNRAEAILLARYGWQMEWS